jgi:Mor family transcriptional regulator
MTTDWERQWYLYEARNKEIAAERAKGRTYVELAESYGITPTRARQIVLNQRHPRMRSWGHQWKLHEARNKEIAAERAKGRTYVELAKTYKITPARARQIAELYRVSPRHMPDVEQ